MLAFVLLFLALTLAAGCVCPFVPPDPGLTPTPLPTAHPSSPTPAATPLPSPDFSACTTKQCFIPLANNCTEIAMTLTEDAGVFRYSSSSSCVFTKTILSLDASETQEMKNLLEGKSLTCRYEKGKFDERWVNSLIFGTEKCEGELATLLAELLAFAE